MNRTIDELKYMNAMRFESPEPESRQGRRNPRAAGVQLLDPDGAISMQVRRSPCIYLGDELIKSSML